MRARLIASAGLLAALSGCGGSAGTTSGTSRSTSRPTSTPRVATAAARPSPPKPPPKPRPKPPPPPKVDPGTLPQTDQLPTAATPGFNAEMKALWAGIQTNSVPLALPAFFPEAAYAQIKAIADAGGDWSDRLVGAFRLDLAAAHALVAGRPAQLVGVQVPQSYAHWVDPGVCYNRVGYYEVPNARVVYRQGGEIRSLGIASMISWRGVWYVVHLGSVLPPNGVVDDPSLGAGTSVPSSTC